MWGLPIALTADGSLSQEGGLTPRVFELLFSRIYEVAYAFLVLFARDSKLLPLK